jgi:hypothetical protein
VGDDFGIENAGKWSVIYSVQALNDVTKNTVAMKMNADTTITVYANYAGILSLDQDVKVTFKVDPALVDVYNAGAGTSYRMMPEGSYSTDVLEATIKKGESTSSPLSVSVDSGLFGGVGTYVLPLHIESVNPGIAVNDELRTAYLFFSAYYDSNPFTNIDRSDWTVVGFSSESPEDGSYATCAIDGDNNTIWHTHWANSVRPGPPHHIDVDLGKTETVHGFAIRARTYTNGDLYNGQHPRSVQLYTKLNETDEWTPGGTFEMVFQIYDYKFLDYAAQARYIRLRVNSGYNNAYGTTLSELYAF